MHWALKELKYRNAKYLYRWHLIKVQAKGDLILKPGRFVIEECLNGQQWWEYLENMCLQHIKEKKQTKYWPKAD